MQFVLARHASAHVRSARVANVGDGAGSRRSSHSRTRLTMKVCRVRLSSKGLAGDLGVAAKPRSQFGPPLFFG